MNAQVAGFRVVLGLVLFGSIAVSAISGALSGAAVSAFSGNAGTGALIGGLIGAAIGWIAGSYVHGIGYTLLSINDQLADIAITLKGGARLTAVDATAPSTVAAAFSISPASAQAQSSLAASPAPATVSYHERLEALPVGADIEINGLIVWKIEDRAGKVYFSGDRSYDTVDELLASYRVS